jgi:hypothetical protein
MFLFEITLIFNVIFVETLFGFMEAADEGANILDRKVVVAQDVSDLIENMRQTKLGG